MRSHVLDGVSGAIVFQLKLGLEAIALLIISRRSGARLRHKSHKAMLS
ncbi:MAG: hypothetical protein OT478_25165 [Cyanobacteria bacterium FC1]|nr:hypothetical protein [Cyanobacteria bacterium FC1]